MPPVSGDLATSIQKAWSGLLDLVSKVVNPDWGALVWLVPLIVIEMGAVSDTRFSATTTRSIG